MSNFWIVCIVAIACATSVAIHYLKRRDDRDPGDSRDDAETLEKIEQLEERIRVLERIVTENRFDLKKEIDSLR